MAHDVFISYSSKDKAVADAICSLIENNGIRCWIAPRDILPGMDWGGAIIDAITESQVMVLILSGNSNASEQVKREVERAVNKGLVIIPFRIEEIKLSKTLEYHLSVTHWMDALTPPLEQHILRLVERVKLLLAYRFEKSVERPAEFAAPKSTENQQSSQSATKPSANAWITPVAIMVSFLFLIILGIAVYVKLNSTPAKSQQIQTESFSQPAKANPEIQNSVTDLVGKWIGSAKSSGGQFQVEVEIYASCSFNQKCGTISVSNVPCYGEIFLKQVNNGVYEFHVDNFDRRSDLKNCQAGAGEYFKLQDDGRLFYSTGYSDAKAMLEKFGKN